MPEPFEIPVKSGTADSFGMHLTLDLARCNPRPLNDLDIIHELLLALCMELRMHALTAPYAFRYDGKGCKADSGITGFLVLAESHISVHTFPYRRYAFVDLFSCREFEKDGVLDILNAAFGFEVHTLQLLSRGRDFPQGDEDADEKVTGIHLNRPGFCRGSIV